MGSHMRDTKLKIDPETLIRLLEILDSHGPRLNVRPYYPPGNVLGIILGGTLGIAGVVLLILGLSGSIEWILQAGTLSSRLVNASPGVAVSFMGMLIVWRYRPRLKYRIEITPPSVEISGDRLKVIGSKITSEGTASSPIQVRPPFR